MSQLPSFPRVHVGQMIGLLEVLEDFTGRVDAAKVADDLMLELDDLLPAVNMAEILGFLKIDSGDLILTEQGIRFLSKGSDVRKRMLNEALMGLGMFRAIVDFIRKENREVTRDELINFLKEEVPDMDLEAALQSIIEWGRYSLLLRYDSTNKRIRLI